MASTHLCIPTWAWPPLPFFILLRCEYQGECHHGNHYSPHSVEIHQRHLQVSHGKQSLAITTTSQSVREPHLSLQDYRLRGLGVVQTEAVSDRQGVLQGPRLVPQPESDPAPQQQQVSVRGQGSLLVALTRSPQDSIQRGESQGPFLPLDVELRPGEEVRVRRSPSYLTRALSLTSTASASAWISFNFSLRKSDELSKFEASVLSLYLSLICLV